MPDVNSINWLLEAFSDLNTTRQFGMDVGPIPFNSVILWADRYEPPSWFPAAIRKIDNHFLKLIAKNG